MILIKIFLTLIITAVTAVTCDDLILLEQGQREPGDVVIYTTTNATTPTDELSEHRLDFYWNGLEDDTLYTGLTFEVSSVCIVLYCILYFIIYFNDMMYYFK